MCPLFLCFIQICSNFFFFKYLFKKKKKKNFFRFILLLSLNRKRIFWVLLFASDVYNPRVIIHISRSFLLLLPHLHSISVIITIESFQLNWLAAENIKKRLSLMSWNTLPSIFKRSGFHVIPSTYYCCYLLSGFFRNRINSPLIWKIQKKIKNSKTRNSFLESFF